jgi:hypothetical protein
VEVAGKLWLKKGDGTPQQVRPAAEPGGSVSFSPDGTELAYADGSACIDDPAALTPAGAQHTDGELDALVWLPAAAQR